MRSLKSALDKFISGAGLTKAVEQSLTVNVWAEAVGKAIADNTEPISVEHGIMTVKVSNSAWRNELLFQKQEIIEKLNNKTGKNTIRNIRFI